MEGHEQISRAAKARLDDSVLRKKKQNRLKKGQVMKDSLSLCSDFMSTADINLPTQERKDIILYYS